MRTNMTSHVFHVMRASTPTACSLFGEGGEACSWSSMAPFSSVGWSSMMDVMLFKVEYGIDQRMPGANGTAPIEGATHLCLYMHLYAPVDTQGVVTQRQGKLRLRERSLVPSGEPSWGKTLVPWGMWVTWVRPRQQNNVVCSYRMSKDTHMARLAIIETVQRTCSIETRAAMLCRVLRSILFSHGANAS